MAEDPRHLRAALGRFATGVTVVTTRSSSGKLEGLTANSFSSVSLDPPLVLWSLQKRAPSLQTFQEAGVFAINVLGVHQRALCRHFATRSANKFLDVPHDLGLGGCPVLADSLAVFECSTHSIVDGGDHWIFIGRVERAVYRDGEPLIFSAGALCVPALFSEADPPSRLVQPGESAPVARECCS